MKKQINEPDFIGGQGSLTKKEEIALREYFAEKKKKKSARIQKKTATTKKSRTLTT
ncbi:hypothetical protein Aeqsu_0086 [Aequorivita sublithincola DSM 14238]|uniref:Uncharacterized protein n=1 Tax=Aequorivita sublithincola (strain DSM 14238 / LMG 21431 / ACAM 643 / 9-3) TaxID=746697 RepID=I3YRJ9_AEQSU|nr:hypothetical protein [Aequorivita sublithincola]AFL79617.1 hypothetical protein Aeqsu_0086 [Aequorivita sublithincola DSM 14238]